MSADLLSTPDSARRRADGEALALNVAEPSPRPGPGLKLVYRVLGVVLVGYAISRVVRGQNGPTWGWLDGWGPCVFETALGLLVVGWALRVRRDRAYALLLGGASLIWAAGDYVANYLGSNAPTLALNNFLWAGFFPLAYVGVMVLMQRDVKRLTAANYLDGVVATLVTAAALVAFAFHPIAVASGGGNEFAAVNIVYPVGDLLLFGLTVLGIALLPAGHRTRWYLFALAGAVNAAGDIAALFNGLAATGPGWFMNVDGLAGLAAAHLGRRVPGPRPERPGQGQHGVGLRRAGHRIGASRSRSCSSARSSTPAR